MKDKYKICTYSEFSKSEEKLILEQVKLIFFEASSVKQFSDNEAKEFFFKRWCGDYLTHYPQYFYLMFNGEQLLGYLSGCQNTIQSMTVLDVPGVKLFSDLYIDFPAHLHINFSSECRGRGLGSILVQHYLDECSRNKIKGVHLITAQNAKNVSFYRKLGFTHEYPRPLQSFTQLFMGILLE
jgi:ribosomal protein S18 acetylase RimI-like enzyme